MLHSYCLILMLVLLRSMYREQAGFNIHSTHNGSFQRWVFPCSQLNWYWPPEPIITKKQKVYKDTRKLT